jgi:hypothetical protein
LKPYRPTWLLVCLFILAACSPAAEPATPTRIASSSIPSSVPTQTTQELPFSTPLSEARKMGEALLVNIPACAGLQVLDEPVTFSWPNISSRMEEIGSAQWGYYHCDQTQSEAAAFYKENLTKPPYRYLESNWVEREEGVVGVFYVWEGTWMYVFIVPYPGQPEKTLVAVAISAKEVDC